MKDIQEKFEQIVELIRGAADYTKRDEELMLLIAKWCGLTFPPAKK